MFVMILLIRARAMTYASDRALAAKLNRRFGDSTEKVSAQDIQELSREQSAETSADAGRKQPRPSIVRHIPPFIPSHDIPRGILFAVQMFITYLLMLAVM